VCAVITWENVALDSPKRVTVLFRDAPAKRQRCPLGRDSSDSIATRYWLKGPGIESQLGAKFSAPSRPTLGPPSLLYNWYRVFLGDKTAEAWR
jgi:hypothetical protein